jgi:hypothetical protein
MADVARTQGLTPHNRGNLCNSGSVNCPNYKENSSKPTLGYLPGRSTESRSSPLLCLYSPIRVE